jgi:trehalose/maltose hydrolase-like predicted phosphorylase
MAYAGIDHRGPILEINPHLPATWEKLSFHIHFQHIHYRFEISRRAVRVQANAESQIRIKSYTCGVGPNWTTIEV